MNNCVQCGKPLNNSVDLGPGLVWVCLHPKCPNYGLLQIAEEKLKEATTREGEEDA